ncbi:MAG: TetR/AcrR family transcriptional regulator [Verrucomicrobiales bacterium]|nr:TetR/AcrR family transcriptional regulator [Verrucomicrobiales bacterium]
MGRTSDAKERLMAAVAELFWTQSYDSSTIDQICEKAGVKKGSFYYFFDGKAQLVEAALDREWEVYRPKLDAIFSASIAPLERIRRHVRFTIEEQGELKARHGYVLGCPLATLGSEICTQESDLRRKVQAIMDHGAQYLETAIRDADAAGEIAAPNAREKARVIRAFQLGLLIQARIRNDMKILEELEPGTLEILGVAKANARRRAATRRREAVPA